MNNLIKSGQRVLGNVSVINVSISGVIQLFGESMWALRSVLSCVGIGVKIYLNIGNIWGEKGGCKNGFAMFGEAYDLSPNDWAMFQNIGARQCVSLSSMCFNTLQ